MPGMDGLPGPKGEDGIIYEGNRGGKGLKGEPGFYGTTGRDGYNVILFSNTNS